MDKKIFFLLSVAAVAISLIGCAPRLIIVRTVTEKLADRGITEDRIRDLEMENAALRAANRHLLGKD